MEDPNKMIYELQEKRKKILPLSGRVLHVYYFLYGVYRLKHMLYMYVNYVWCVVIVVHSKSFSWK